MGLSRIIGILLIVAGALGLAYGGFSYTKETHSAKVGPMEFRFQEKETVLVPVLVSAGAIGIGMFLLVGLKSK